jgi:hypothetical protein
MRTKVLRAFVTLLLCFAIAQFSLGIANARQDSAGAGKATEPVSQSGSQQAPAGPRVFLESASHGSQWNAARDQSMEMSKDFLKVCPSVRITIKQEAADYTIRLNHIEHGFVRDNQIQVFDGNGDLLKNKEGGSIKGDVKKVCEMIQTDWSSRQASKQ